MQKLFYLMIMVFMVTACFGETNEETVDKNEVENGENQIEINQEELGEVEYLSCDIDENETTGEYRIRFVDGQLKDMDGMLTVYYPELQDADEFESLEDFGDAIKEHFDEEYRAVVGVTSDVYRDEDTIKIELYYDFSRMEKTTDGYYSYFYEHGDKIFESMDIDELLEEIDGHMSCEKVTG